MEHKKMLRLHLLARPGEQRGKIVRVSTDEVESGDWRSTPDAAEAAVGAEIHLREFQADRSWRSGVITAWRWHESDNGRVVYRFRVDDSLRRVQRIGWPARGERNVIWDGPAEGQT